MGESLHFWKTRYRTKVESLDIFPKGNKINKKKNRWGEEKKMDFWQIKIW